MTTIHIRLRNVCIITYRSVLSALLVSGMAACSTTQVSEKISDYGLATGLVFPKPNIAWYTPSTFPSNTSLRQVDQGVSKHQLYQLFGPPHFSEAHGAREWDYVFKFRDAQDAPVKTCQYKVIFDKNMLGQSFHWKPKNCIR